MADTLFPKREERVPYGSGTPAKRDRKNTKGKKTGRTNRNKPTEKKRGKKDGKKLNRNALYLIGIIVILFIVFLFVRKNGSAVYIADEQVGILETRKVTAKELTATLESQLEGIVVVFECSCVGVFSWHSVCIGRMETWFRYGTDSMD